MADTERTKSYLLASVFQDGQAAGSITPADMRDFVVSLSPSHGAMYLSTPAATTISVAGTYYKEASTWSAMDTQEGFTQSSNRLTYNGATTQHFLVMARITMSAASNNQVVGLTVAKNGTPVTGMASTTKLLSSGDPMGLSTFGHVSLASGDYIEVFLTNSTSTAALTAVTATCFVMRIFE